MLTAKRKGQTAVRDTIRGPSCIEEAKRSIASRVTWKPPITTSSSTCPCTLFLTSWGLFRDWSKTPVVPAWISWGRDPSAKKGWRFRSNPSREWIRFHRPAEAQNATDTIAAERWMMPRMALCGNRLRLIWLNRQDQETIAIVVRGQPCPQKTLKTQHLGINVW